MFRDNEITSWFYINHNRFALFFTFPVFLFLLLLFFFYLCSVIARLLI